MELWNGIKKYIYFWSFVFVSYCHNVCANTGKCHWCWCCSYNRGWYSGVCGDFCRSQNGHDSKWQCEGTCLFLLHIYPSGFALIDFAIVPQLETERKHKKIVQNVFKINCQGRRIQLIRSIGNISTKVFGPKIIFHFQRRFTCVCMLCVHARERGRHACGRSMYSYLINRTEIRDECIQFITMNERWIRELNAWIVNIQISTESVVLRPYWHQINESVSWFRKTKTQSRRGDLPQQLITKSSLFLFVCAGCAQIEWKNWECSTVAGFLRKHLSHRDEIHVSTTHAYHLDLVNKLSLHTCIFDKYIQLYTNTNTWILRTLYPSWHILFSKQTQNFLIN